MQHHEVAKGLLEAGLILFLGGLGGAALGSRINLGSLLAAGIGAALAVASIPFWF